MSTIRFELMREGLEDHEYLWMLRDRLAKLKAAPKGAANPDLLARAESLLKRAEQFGGNYTSAGDEYYFDGYLREPTKLLALRHDIGETVEVLVKATPPKAPYAIREACQGILSPVETAIGAGLSECRHEVASYRLLFGVVNAARQRTSRGAHIGAGKG